MPESISLAVLDSQLTDCLLKDRARLEKRLKGLQRRAQQGKPYDRGLNELVDEIETSRAALELRRVNLPEPEYLLDLPVVNQREIIRQTIAENQVVIVAGETGSGKTTQLPKICLELGLGARGMIGHTQPRRIAARNLAARIAEELHAEVGQGVGFKMRFSDHVSPNSYIKVMTDGILLAETQSDPGLYAYDTIIIDEAHERSLNIDFLLGYLKRLLPRRPDLKIIITSATIDVNRFSKHFDDAPVIEVSGRAYPVEMRYRPVQGDSDEDKDRDRGHALLEAVDELAKDGPGDMLVFFPGEREIREAAELLRKHHPAGTEILPLYGRLSTAQQQQVFKTHNGRRIVLSTNVAETSLTVPGIRYVIDTGLARVSRYSYRTKVQRLPIEPISQASANQRAGRCGRVGPGICIRLYSEEDYQSRSEFTDPEILRTNLAAVILQMLSLKLGDIEDFPFINPPDARFIRDGFKLLHELHAVDNVNRLTQLGRKLARLPMDVRLGRMVLAAEKEGCLKEVLIIAAALAIQDPRERPMDKAQAADEKQRQFRDEQSDFLSYLKLWNFYQDNKKHLTQNKLRKLCQQYYLSYIRLREWRETYSQLKTLIKDLGAKLNDNEADYTAIHRALLTGLLGNIAFKTEEREYTGARGIKLKIFPGSGLIKKVPKWLVAAELVETGQRYARTVAKIEPEWVEGLSGHLVKRHFFDPHWEKRRGHVVASERVSLYGLVLTPQRKMNYDKVKPEDCRDLFIEGALVRGELQGRYDFLPHNRQLFEEVLDLEAKSRRRDVLVEESRVAAFFAERVPAAIVNAAQFDKWYQRATEGEREALKLGANDLMQHEADAVTDSGFPEQLDYQGMNLNLHYHFEPGAKDDGVTVIVPAVILNQLRPALFDWLVPGLLEEKVTQLIRSLPKTWRRHFVPAPDFARAFLESHPEQSQPLLETLTQHLKKITAIEVPEEAWRLDQLPAHLFMNFRVVEGDEQLLDEGRSLSHLQAQVGHQAEQEFTGLRGHNIERENVQVWDFGELPEHIELSQQGISLRGYPALVAEQGRVDIRVLDDMDKAAQAHQQGLQALFKLTHAKAVRYAEKNLPRIDQMCLHFAPVGQCAVLKTMLVEKAIKQALLSDDFLIRDQETYEERAQSAERQLPGIVNELCEWVSQALADYHQLGKRLKGNISPAWLTALSDVQDQLGYLLSKHFIHDVPYDNIKHLARYLRAINKRLDKLEQNLARDKQLAAQVAPWWEKCKQRCFEGNQLKEGEALRHFRWLIEEYRVSLFAQELGTKEPVSDKRLAKAWQAL